MHQTLSLSFSYIFKFHRKRLFCNLNQLVFMTRRSFSSEDITLENKSEREREREKKEFAKVVLRIRFAVLW